MNALPLPLCTFPLHGDAAHSRVRNASAILKTPLGTPPMRSIFLSGLALVALASQGVADARDPIPAEALSRMQEIQSISMSSDGRQGA